jgi:hypothetical protein
MHTHPMYKTHYVRLQNGASPDHFPVDKQVRFKSPRSRRWFPLQSYVTFLPMMGISGTSPVFIIVFVTLITSP